MVKSSAPASRGCPLFLVLPLLAFAATVSWPTGAAAQTTGPCSAQEYRQFDFWIGSWEVYSPDGKRTGNNRIERVLGGCALHESWQSAGGGNGHSYSFYDAATGRWHQTWIDGSGQALYLDGGHSGQSMVLADATNRITWTPLENRAVRQHWESTSDGGETWTTVFNGEYRPTDGLTAAPKPAYETATRGTRLLEGRDGGTLIKVLVEQSNLGGTEVELAEIEFAANSRGGGHAHGSVEIFYILSGELQHIVNGETSLLKPGMVGIVRPGDEVVHAVPGNEPCRVLVIWAPGGEVERIARFFTERPIDHR